MKVNQNYIIGFDISLLVLTVGVYTGRGFTVVNRIVGEEAELIYQKLISPNEQTKDCLKRFNKIIEYPGE